MKILHLISSLGFFGAENVLIQLNKELRHKDNNSFIGIIKNLHNPHLETADEARRYNLPVEIFPCNGRLDIKTILLIRSFIERKKIDIIHTHGYKSNLYALASSFGKSVSLVTTCHNWLGSDLKMKIYAQMDKFFLKRFNKIIAVSDNVEREILRHRINPNKVLKIRNGVEVERFKNHKDTSYIYREFKIKPEDPIIGTVGRLAEEKGHKHFLGAAEKILEHIPEAVFMVVGDGPLRKELETQVDNAFKTTPNNIHFFKSPFIFTGIRTDMPEIYSVMNIFVLPSDIEGLPMALLEAMASKKPVVATRVGAVPQVIQDGYSGCLVEPKDVQGLSRAIEGLLADPQKAHKLAENGYEKVKNEFSSKTMAERYLEVYKEVLAMPKRK